MVESTYDPAVIVGALPHFKSHLLSRSVRSWGLLSGVARAVTERIAVRNWQCRMKV